MLPHRPVFGVFALLTTTLGLYLATLVRKHHAWYLYLARKFDPKRRLGVTPREGAPKAT